MDGNMETARYINHFIYFNHIDMIRYSLVPGTLSLPQPNIPVIFIGPGTGIAPMRCLIQDRINQQAYQNILFFGCRHQDADFLYEQEWKSLVTKGFLKLFMAFSRDQEHKIYVQDEMRKQGALVYNLMEHHNAVILLSG